MPSIPMYLDDADVDLLGGWLNADPQIAFLVPLGNPQTDLAWKAVERVARLLDGTHVLWHVPSGPLHYPDPLYLANGVIGGMEEGPVIDDPWAGWAAEGAGATPTVPGLGGSPAIIMRLAIHREGLDFANRGRKPIREWKRSEDVLGMSDFGWIGNRYRPIGYPASKAVELWWRRLRRRIAKIAVAIPAYGPLTGPLHMPVFAFPTAYQAILGGKARDDNPL